MPQVNSGKKSEPEVILFGSSVDTAKHDHEGSVVWGILLILAGSIFLTNTLQILPWEIWVHVLEYWPLLLILAGVQIILGNNIISRLLITALTIILFGAVVILALDKVAPHFTQNLPQDLRQLLNQWETIKP